MGQVTVWLLVLAEMVALSAVVTAVIVAVKDTFAVPAGSVTDWGTETAVASLVRATMTLF